MHMMQMNPYGNKYLSSTELKLQLNTKHTTELSIELIHGKFLCLVKNLSETGVIFSCDQAAL